MVNFIVWLIAGGIIGGLANWVMRTDAQHGTLFNVIVGAVGAFLAGLMLTPLLGISVIQDTFSMPALRLSLLGALLLLAIVSRSRREALRVP